MSPNTATLDANRLQLDALGLEQLFLGARSQNAWQDVPVDDAVLHELYDIAKMAPTSANSQPMRVVFAKGDAAKARLKPALMPKNVEKTMTAPVTAIVAYDTKFYEHLHRIFPHDKTAPYWFSGEGKEAVATATAFRNGTLQGAYLIIAARAIGLDVGAMSGFDNAKVDEAFFPDGRFKSNFLCNLGYGDSAKLFNRSPRLEFDEAVTLA